MDTVIILLVAVALIHTVATFYGRLIRSTIGLIVKGIGAARNRRGSDFDNPSY